MYQVLIIEDDPMVASIDRQYVERMPDFRVAAVFKHGGDALDYLAGHSVDLIVLDYYAPVMNGLEFLDKLHSRGQFPSIIMVTSANETDIVRRLFSRGVLDYLVKPFDYARFRQAMCKFLQARQTMQSDPATLDQRHIDKMFLAQERDTLDAPLAKGMNAATLARVRSFLSAHAGMVFTTEQIADQIGLSRITVRRYVNYMVEEGTVTSSIDYQTGGRPSIQYCYTD